LTDRLAPTAAHGVSRVSDGGWQRRKTKKKQRNGQRRESGEKMEKEEEEREREREKIHRIHVRTYVSAGQRAFFSWLGC
jgi:hypothetical protein